MASLPPLLGRRVHISGSIHEDLAIASTQSVNTAREFVRELVIVLLKNGATFVVPIDAEPVREGDDLPICFDWLIFETIAQNINLRPSQARMSAEPVIVAVQHQKNAEQIPAHRQEVWDSLRDADGLLVEENAGHWNMNSKRMEIQSQQGDLLIALGGAEGVLFLANLYHSQGKPVIPLPFALCPENRGARRLWEQALVGTETHRFFTAGEGQSSHHLINRLNFSSKKPVADKVQQMISVLENLRKPRVFAVRLLNDKEEQFKDVENFFVSVVKPVVEELGYELKTVDGRNVEEATIDREIFENLHYCSAVVADLTGERPNCFLELGYALGQGYPVMICAQEGTKNPFDTNHITALYWNTKETDGERRRLFRDYWENNFRRPPLVKLSPLVP